MDAPNLSTLDGYQAEARRTTVLDLPLETRLARNGSPKIDPETARQWLRYQDLANGGLGLSGEAGEVAELLKKHLFHGKELDTDQLKKELGDVLWYLAFLASIAELSLSEIAEANIEKLRIRYPNGFNCADAAARRDLKDGAR